MYLELVNEFRTTRKYGDEIRLRPPAMAAPLQWIILMFRPARLHISATAQVIKTAFLWLMESDPLIITGRGPCPCPLR